MSSVGERIRSRRLELGWTQEHLAETAHLSKGFLSDLETGKRNVSADYLLEIAQALGVSLDFLMKGDSSQPKSVEVQIPAALSDFAKQEGLTFAQTLMLLDMRGQIVAHRSNTKSDDLEKFDWKRFYEAVKGFLK
jgi:transcriptional regulator with XRE-family HTH domain